MAEKSVIVLADPADWPYYRQLEIPGEELEILEASAKPETSAGLRAEIVLMDCGTRIKRGLKTLREIKRSVPQTAIILLTDVSSELTATTAFRLGARDYFRKPVPPSLLRDVISGLLKLKRSSRERRSPFRSEADEISTRVNEIKEKEVPERLLNILLHIEENLQGPLTLGSLAELARLDKSYFTRYFKSHVGMSPIRYLNDKRTRLAEHLLRRTDLNITQISQLAGFGDLSSFNKHFKKANGISPSGFRKKNRDGRFPTKSIV